MNIVSATITGSLILNGVNISSVTGSESSINALNLFTASAATTGSNQFNGNQTVTGSVNITGSLIVTGSIIGTVTTASYVLNAVSASYATNSDLLDGRDSLTFANTGSNNFVGTQNINGAVAITGSLTTTGAITAQTLNVQQVTSSIVYSSGSNIFGNSISNTQSMTGSVGISGSLAVVGAATFSGSVFLNTTVAYTSELNVQAIAANRPAIKAGYGVVAGNGYWLLGDNYTTDESLMAIGIDYSSGGLVLGSALAPSTTTSGAFISTQAQFGGYGSAIRLGTNGEIVFYNGTQNSVIAAGSAKTASVALTISQTGAATFSSSVTANVITSTSSGSTQLFLKSTGGGSNRDWQFQTSETAAGDLSIMQSTTAGGATYATKLNISSTGNVGIGTTAPGAPLSFADTNALKIQLNGGAGNYYGIEKQAAVSGGDGLFKFESGKTSAGEFAFSTGGTNRMIITSGGNVLIGTTTAGALLEVKQPTLAIASIFQAWAPGVGGATFKVISTTGQPYMQYDFNNGNVGIGTTNPLGKLTTFGGAVQFIGDYDNHHTIIKSTGNQGTFNGSLVITIPEMSTASGDGYGGFSCEVYVAGYNGMYCHVWFSGYINGGITASEAAILRSNGGWSVSQASSGTYNQGFTFTIDYPNGIIHPTARIIFNKGGNLSATAYPANSITAVWS